MQTSTELKNLLNRIDHKSYPAYKDTKGVYQFPGYQLSIDHVQGDPFASPSKLSIHMKGAVSAFPKELYETEHRRIALQDYLTRQFARAVERYAFKAKGSGKSGLIAISRCNQEVLERTACKIDPKSGDLILRLEAGFPANGRTINARELMKILFEFLPESVENSLYYKNSDKKKIQQTVFLADDQQYIREQLPKMGLAAFVADGSILPRESGISSRPMKGAVAFTSPEELKVTMELPHQGKISGMGIRKGITLIVGGGYHGKSTLLKALELGVYNHISGDGREYVITDDTAMKIRAEDGRSIKKTDISMFINDLPNGKETRGFYTEDASGSTSQAANVIEGMEAGAKLLLIDEDTSATNFMIRDELMQRVIHRDMEPITPFIERIRELYDNYGVSTIIVAGSSGAYFQIADSIVQMDRYVPRDITELAKKEAEGFPVLSGPEQKAEDPVFTRCPGQNRALSGNDRIKMKTLGKEAVQINRESIDLRYVEQLVDSEQVSALGYCVKYAEKHLLDGRKSIQTVVEELEKKIRKDGLAGLCESSSNIAALAVPRKQEIHACLNRYRGLKL
ncbi:MAG: ABC-ATPase domain-containing protein [Faecalicatena sp.]|uniref:ABC-ATPase domain-containing protein n=1 Tax=Faecalicatena sp. TaxID=2005360 RepID=UPI002583A722|nr:ABC-ATPase domain-containing protein [Faecalicatena sp.]MCI6464503.1 ABC-ATPase domain-containing protein [Faecalicatena sp.]MDY5619065.1 ABC-ATPase domain-containing protein [Lachnospiraceae bacterium]